MNSRHSHQFVKAHALLVIGCAAFLLSAPRSMADAPVASLPSANNATDYLQLGYVLNSCYSHLNFKVQNATLEEIVVRIHKAMASLNSRYSSAPPIEIRQARSVRLSFALKDTTPMKVLASAGQLANVQLWVFPDRIVLAPAKALTATELAATTKGLGVQLKLKDFLNPVFVGGGRVAVMVAIADEIKPKVKTTAKTGEPAPTDQPSGKVALRDLSPESLAMLRLLISSHNESSAQSMREYQQELPDFNLGLNPPFGAALSDTITVNADDGGSLLINSAESGTLAFALNGRLVRRGVGRPSSAPPSVAPPLLDPSAHES